MTARGAYVEGWIAGYAAARGADLTDTELRTCAIRAWTRSRAALAEGFENEGIAAVLDVLGPDLPAHEWARRLGVPIARVRRILRRASSS